MRYKNTLIGVGIAAFLALPAFSQIANQQATSNTTTTPVAHVYVGSAQGVDLYQAAPNGSLTLAGGSPFKITGLAVGSNGKNFISMGTYWLHAYPVTSSGGIGKQVSTIDTQNYYGNGKCGSYNPGTMGLANLDHTGKDLYVPFPNLNGDCEASIQTYKISDTGLLTFDGGIMTGTNAGSGLFQAPAINSTDTFAYAASDFDCCGAPPGWIGYRRASNGELQNLTFNLSNGQTIPLGYVPFYVTADPYNHLAAIVARNPGEGEYDPAQLASYTIDSSGNLSSTATATNMPHTKVTPWILNMSPSGKLLAVGGQNGLQIFHFNGGNPITTYSGVLTSAAINHIRWDKNNHLYALSEAQTTSDLSFSGNGVTNVKITGTDGSSYTIGTCSGSCSGFQIVTPKSTTTYTISGTGPNGGRISASATVTVHTAPGTASAPAAAPNTTSAPALRISANPSSVNNYSQLFVYTVTPTSIAAAPGSPHVISRSGVDALIVVP